MDSWKIVLRDCTAIVGTACTFDSQHYVAGASLQVKAGMIVPRHFHGEHIVSAAELVKVLPENEALRTRLAELETELSKTRAGLEAKEAAVTRLEGQLAGLRERLAAVSPPEAESKPRPRRGLMRFFGGTR